MEGCGSVCNNGANALVLKSLTIYSNVQKSLSEKLCQSTVSRQLVSNIYNYLSWKIQLVFLVYKEIFDLTKGCIFTFDSSDYVTSRSVVFHRLFSSQSISLLYRCERYVSRCWLMEPNWIQSMNGDAITTPVVTAVWIGGLRGYQDGKSSKHLSVMSKRLTHQLSWRLLVCSNISDDSAAFVPFSSPWLLWALGGLCGGLTPADWLKNKKNSWELSTGRYGLEQRV